jgi:hypothetical protein
LEYFLVYIFILLKLENTFRSTLIQRDTLRKLRFYQNLIPQAKTDLLSKNLRFIKIRYLFSYLALRLPRLP